MTNRISGGAFNDQAKYENAVTDYFNTTHIKDGMLYHKIESETILPDSTRVII